MMQRSSYEITRQRDSLRRSILKALETPKPTEWLDYTFATKTFSFSVERLSPVVDHVSDKPPTVEQIQEALDVLEAAGEVCRTRGGNYMRRKLPTGTGGPAYQVKPNEIRGMTSEGRAELEQIQKRPRKRPVPRDKRRKITLADVKREAVDDGRRLVFESEGTTFRLFP